MVTKPEKHIGKRGAGYSVRPCTGFTDQQEFWAIGHKVGAHDKVIAYTYSEDTATLIAGLLNGVRRWL